MFNDSSFERWLGKKLREPSGNWTIEELLRRKKMERTQKRKWFFVGAVAGIILSVVIQLLIFGHRACENPTESSTSTVRGMLNEW